MPAKEVILVQVLDTLPSHGFGQLLLKRDVILYAQQEFFSPVVENEDDNGYEPANEFVEGAIPVVHVWLEFSLAAFPLADLDKRGIDGPDVPQTPLSRQSEIWIPGFIENFYADIMGEMPPAEKETLGMPMIDYYSLVVTDNSISFDISPVVDADTYYVSLNGTKIQDDVNTSISLTGLEGQTEYAIILQARKNNVAYNYSELNLMAITTEAAP